MDALKQGPSTDLSIDIDGNLSRPINVDEYTRPRIAILLFNCGCNP